MGDLWWGQKVGTGCANSFNFSKKFCCGIQFCPRNMLFDIQLALIRLSRKQGKNHCDLNFECRIMCMTFANSSRKATTHFCSSANFVSISLSPTPLCD